MTARPAQDAVDQVLDPSTAPSVSIITATYNRSTSGRLAERPPMRRAPTG